VNRESAIVNPPSPLPSAFSLLPYICLMLQLNVIRQNPDFVKDRLRVKYFSDLTVVDQLLSLDEEKRKVQLDSENVQSKANLISKEIGQLMAKGQKEEAAMRKQEVEMLNASIKPMRSQLAEIEKQLDDLLVRLPNLPSPLVPPGKTPEENEIVRQHGDVPDLPSTAMPHWELAKKYNLIDFDLGNKVTGSGFPFYVGRGARLQRALINYFLHYNTSAGYLEVQPPYMVNESSAYGTGQLPDKEGQMYHATQDNFYLIPTAEVPVTNIYRDEILKENQLPVKMTAYSPCFRREAGSYGKDVRGLNRLHQFDKVEIVQLVEPGKSYETLEQMVAHVEKLVQSLQLPYRILRLCGGDMSFASALTYDFEVYSAAQKKWLEVSSVSNFESFQTNRMKIRYKGESGKTQLVHSLNGSSMALPRIVAALLENNQSESGIRVPNVLQPYFGQSIIE
jgi:seryl-tRNA synthetase